MAKGFKHGAGDNSLNFKVICNPKPETAKENTIWVDTDRITGWIFSKTEPDSPIDGMMWFETGRVSHVAFNVLKKNDIQIYPLSGRQYISGAWIERNVQCVQNGEWVDWVTYLFQDGVNKLTLRNHTQGTLTINNNRLIFTGGTWSASGAWAYIGKVNISDISSLHINITQFSDSGLHLYLGITTQVSDLSNLGTPFSAVTDCRSTGEFAIDLSNISGEYYLVVSFFGAGTIAVDEIYYK